MLEYVTDALVLSKEPYKDFDARYVFFTRRFGKISGKATSVRKITSKLAGHLEPGTLAQVRFVEKNHGNGTQIVDALGTGRLYAALPNLGRLAAILAEGDADEALWSALTEGRFSWREILRIQGWDPEGAVCAQCGREAAAAFLIPRQDFLCDACASKIRPDALILLTNGTV